MIADEKKKKKWHGFGVKKRNGHRALVGEDSETGATDLDDEDEPSTDEGSVNSGDEYADDELGHMFQELQLVGREETPLRTDWSRRTLFCFPFFAETQPAAAAAALYIDRRLSI